MSSTQGNRRSAVAKALEQPEILDLVARALPLFTWNESFQDELDGFLEFQPWVFLSSICVSRLWHQVFMPHLWHYHFNHQMDPTLEIAMDRDVFLRNFSLARRHMYATVPSYQEPIFTSEDDDKAKDGEKTASAVLSAEEMREQMRVPMPKHLLGLFIYMKPTEMMTRLVVANAHQLRELHLEGRVQIPMSDIPEAVLQSMKSMPCLQDLSLTNWRVSTNDLVEILEVCQDSLQILSLMSVSGFEIPSRSSSSLSSMPSSLPPMPKNSHPQVDPWARVKLNRLKELSLRLDWTESKTVVFLPRLCPNLESIKLEVDTESNLEGLIQTLREFCPKMKALQYKEGYSMEQEQGYFPEPEIFRSLIEDCARPLHEQDRREQRGEEQENHRDAAMEGMTTAMSGMMRTESKTILRREGTGRTSTLSSLIISAENGLDETLTNNIVVHAPTLERLWVNIRHRGTASQCGRQIQRIMQSCPQLKSVSFHDLPDHWDWKQFRLLLLGGASTTTLPQHGTTDTALTASTIPLAAEWACKGLQKFVLEELSPEDEEQDDLEAVNSTEKGKFDGLIGSWEEALQDSCRSSEQKELQQLFLLIRSQSDSLRRVDLDKILFTRLV